MTTNILPPVKKTLFIILTFLATNDGCINIYNVEKKTLAYSIANKNKVPFSCVRWRQYNDNNKTNNVLLTCNSEGEIQHWHMTTGKF